MTKDHLSYYSPVSAEVPKRHKCRKIYQCFIGEDAPYTSLDRPGTEKSLQALRHLSSGPPVLEIVCDQRKISVSLKEVTLVLTQGQNHLAPQSPGVQLCQGMTGAEQVISLPWRRTVNFLQLTCYSCCSQIPHGEHIPPPPISPDLLLGGLLTY